MTGWSFCSEIQQLLHGEPPIAAAWRDVRHPATHERGNEQQNTPWILWHTAMDY